MIPTRAETAIRTGNPSQVRGHSLEKQRHPGCLRLVSAPGGCPEEGELITPHSHLELLFPNVAAELTATCIQIWVHGRPRPPAIRGQGPGLLIPAVANPWYSESGECQHTVGAHYQGEIIANWKAQPCHLQSDHSPLSLRRAFRGPP